MNEIFEPFLSNSTPTSQVELTLSARNLLNTDILSKSDPYCIVSMKELWQNKYYEIARTEMIKDSLNPQWVKKVFVNYSFESIQRIRFEIRDEDVGVSDFLGYFETTLADLVSYFGRQYIRKLLPKGDKKIDCGQIIVVTEEVSTCKRIAEIQFRATNLPKLNPLIRNDPFLIISRSNEDGSFSVVIKTDPVRSTQNPIFKPITIRIATLCNGDFERDIKIECFDYRSNGNHVLIGTCYTNLKCLITPDNQHMTLIDEQRLRVQSTHCKVGELNVDEIHIDEETTFLDYIRNGTQMHFAVAIDFTGSNGVPIDPNSLHYLCDEQLNSYEIALSCVGEIFQQYDRSKKLLALGKEGLAFSSYFSPFENHLLSEFSFSLFEIFFKKTFLFYKIKPFFLFLFSIEILLFLYLKNSFDQNPCGDFLAEQSVDCFGTKKTTIFAENPVIIKLF